MRASVSTIPGAAPNLPLAETLARRRRASDRLVAGLCIVATVIGVLFLASILWTLVSRGIAGISLGVLYKNTAPAGSNLRNSRTHR